MLTTNWQSTIRNTTMDHFIGLAWPGLLISLTWLYLSSLLDMGLCYLQQYTIYHQYNMKLQWYQTINHVHNQPKFCWLNLYKYRINPYFTLWISFKVFHSRLLQHRIQNIYGATSPNSLETIPHIRDLTIDTYIIVNLHWEK